MPTRLCLHPRCPNPVAYRGRCADHARQREQGTHPNKSVYNSKRWLMLRRHRLFLNPLCQHRYEDGTECGEVATDVDHIKPIQAGGLPYQLENTQALCHSHHSIKTKREQATQ